MIINKNSQLGLRFSDTDSKVKCLELARKDKEVELDQVQYKIHLLQSEDDNTIDGKEDVIRQIKDMDVSLPEIAAITNQVTILDLVKDDNSSYYYICDSVYKCAELIRISENFTGRTIKDIKLGKYTYLMGKNEMVRFVCVVGGIYGFYYNDKTETYFEWVIEMKEGKYCFNKNYDKHFTTVMRLLTFIELGDIEVLVLETGRNNGGKINEDKITNKSNNTVFVVDSTWNKIIIRTDGFAVRGHFRLQPCGANMQDRKLVWIDAFEKHGYKRRPKAEVRN